MMVGIIGIVVSIVGVDMGINQNNRRDFVQDEYDLYDKKAKTAWDYVCSVTGWKNNKLIEDYQEDAIVKIDNISYLTELQIVAYWHNFGLDDWNDNYKFSNMYIAASKVKALQDKISDLDNTLAGKLIFFNCVPNEMLTFNVNDLDDSMMQERYGELTYVIPIKTTKHKYITFKNIIDNGYDFPKCDCREFHLDILNRHDSRINNELRKENIRGFNGICCR